jgi:rubrerythrin
MEENLKARERERTATRQAEQPQHQEKDASLKCPHCGAALDRPDYEICPVCGWEDDPVQRRDPDFAGGANTLSLNEARREYHEEEE